MGHGIYPTYNLLPITHELTYWRYPPCGKLLVIFVDFVVKDCTANCGL